MWRSPCCCLAVLAPLGVSLSLSVPASCRRSRRRGERQRDPDKILALLDQLEPSRDTFYIQHTPSSSYSRSSFSILYDSSRRSPKWVVEHLRNPIENKGGETSSSPIRRKRPPFHMEEAIDEAKFRTYSAMFKHSGYDRGHMVTAANFRDSEDMYHHTFSMANICPQSSGMNRGIWKRLEAFTEKLRRDNEDVIVITGPAYLPTWSESDDGHIFQIKAIGSFPNFIYVPTHFFKVILTRQFKAKSADESKDSLVLCCAAFLIPNTDLHHIKDTEDVEGIFPLLLSIVFNQLYSLLKKVKIIVPAKKGEKGESSEATNQSWTSFEKFVVKIEDLEALVGTKFFTDDFSEFVSFFDSCVEYDTNKLFGSSSLMSCAADGRYCPSVKGGDGGRFIQLGDCVCILHHLCNL